MSLPVLYTFYDSDKKRVAQTRSSMLKMFYLSDESEKKEAVYALIRAVKLSETQPENWGSLERIAFVQIQDSKNLQPIEDVVARAEQNLEFPGLVEKIKKAFPVKTGKASARETTRIADGSQPGRNDPAQAPASAEPKF